MSRPLIISIHVPKTGGYSFGEVLKRVFQEKMLFMICCDSCGSFLFDPVRDNVSARLLKPCAEHRIPAAELLRNMRERGIECLHGHVQPVRIYRYFPRAQYVVWLRDPVQRAVSHYEFFLRHPQLSPLWSADSKKIFQEKNFPAFVRREGNMQSTYLRNFPLRRFSFVGTMEDMENDVRRFGERFGIPVTQAPRLNMNPNKTGREYALSAENEDMIRKENPKDLRLYEEAVRLKGKENRIANRCLRILDAALCEWKSHA